MGPIFDALGVPVTVTRPAPDNDPIETSGIWIMPLAGERPPMAEISRQESEHLMALDRAVVPAAPRGTRIAAPRRLGGPIECWRVDGPEHVDADHLRVYLVPDPEES
jgi:hypothetical protein